MARWGLRYEVVLASERARHRMGGAEEQERGLADSKDT